jgi:hypothetical protein
MPTSDTLFGSWLIVRSLFGPLLYLYGPPYVYGPDVYGPLFVLSFY